MSFAQFWTNSPELCQLTGAELPGNPTAWRQLHSVPPDAPGQSAQLKSKACNELPTIREKK